MTGPNLTAALIALVAGVIFTASFALQQRANLVAMTAGERGARAVMRRPEWVGGVLLQPVGFALQATALGIGTFVVVQTALTAQLMSMVPAGAWVLRRRMRPGELLAPLVVLVGVAVFQAATRPTPGVDVAPWSDWVGPLAAVVAIFGAFFAAGQVVPPYRAALRGAAVGTWGALMSALAKQAVGTAALGWGALVRGWATWALVATGLTSFLWVNLALRSGRLASALATMASLTPVVSVGLALTVFGEDLARGAGARAVAGLGVVLTAAGVAAIARSPSLVALGREAGTAGPTTPTGPTERTGETLP